MLAPIVEILCEIDDYRQFYFGNANRRLLPNPQRLRKRGRQLRVSEIMALFQLSPLARVQG